jgi:hypothetical protein
MPLFGGRASMLEVQNQALIKTAKERAQRIEELECELQTLRETVQTLRETVEHQTDKLRRELQQARSETRQRNRLTFAQRRGGLLICLRGPLSARQQRSARAAWR